MTHAPVRMTLSIYEEIPLLDDKIVELTCPDCGRTIVDYERNIVFHDYLYVCTGKEETTELQQEVDEDIPF